MEKWTPIISLIIAIATALITTFLIPYLRKKMTQTEWETTLNIIDMVVSAAEQMYPNAGDRKKYVIAFLESCGITINETTLNAIEAAVLRLHRELYGEWTKDVDK